MKLNTKRALAVLPLLALAIAGCNSNSAGAGGSGAAGAAANVDTSEAVAKVGDESISRGEMFTFLEAQQGEGALRALLDQHLVAQEAKAKGVTVSDEDVNAEMARLQESTPALGEIIKAGGPRVEVFKQQIRSQMLLNQLLTRDIKADPKAVEAWLNSPDPMAGPGQSQKTRARYDKPAQYKLGILFTSQKAQADVLASQLKSGKSFSDLVAEQKKTKDPIASQSTASTAEARNGAPAPNGGFLPDTSLPAPLKSALATLKVNQTTPPIQLSPSPASYGIVQLLDRKPEVKVTATDPTVVMDYKLTQAAQATIKKAQPKATVAQIVQQIVQQAQQQAMAAMQQGNFNPQIPTYRQAIDQINAGSLREMVTKLGQAKEGNVAILDKQYEALAANYKPIPTAAPIGTPGAGGAPAGTSAAGGASNGTAPAGGTSAGSASTGSAPAAGGASAGSTPAAR